MSFYITDDNIGHLDHTVMTSESDSYNTTRLSLYQALVQEIAGLHADKRGVGIPDLQSNGKTWVIARSRMEVYYYGSWKDEIEVEKVKAAHFVNPGENVVVHSAFLPKDVAVAQNLVKTGADFFLCLSLFVEDDNILTLGSSETGVDIGDPGIAHCKVQIEEVADETVAGASGLKIEIPAETVLVVAFEEQVQKRAV